MYQPRLLDGARRSSRSSLRPADGADLYPLDQTFHPVSRQAPPGVDGRAGDHAFLTYLAEQRNVAASTQNQALSAILFLYKQVLKRDLDWLDVIVGAERPPRLSRLGSAMRHS